MSPTIPFVVVSIPLPSPISIVFLDNTLNYNTLIYCRGVCGRFVITVPITIQQNSGPQTKTAALDYSLAAFIYSLIGLNGLSPTPGVSPKLLKSGGVKGAGGFSRDEEI